MKRAKETKDIPVFVRLPRELDEFLERVAGSIGGTKSQLILMAVESMRPGLEVLERVMKQIRDGDTKLAEEVLELAKDVLKKRGVTEGELQRLRKERRGRVSKENR